MSTDMAADLTYLVDVLEERREPHNIIRSLCDYKPEYPALSKQLASIRHLWRGKYGHDHVKRSGACQKAALELTKHIGTLERNAVTVVQQQLAQAVR